jgi:hypothetical protein
MKEWGWIINNEQDILDRWVKYFNKLLNVRKDNECVTFTTTSSNQILKGKAQDPIDAPTIEEIEIAEIKK